LEGCQLEASLGKKLPRHHINQSTNKHIRTVPSMREIQVGKLRSKAGSWQKCETLSEKLLKQKGLGMTQVVEHLPSKCEASSNFSTTKSKKSIIIILII
jgi:hypothetical protein